MDTAKVVLQIFNALFQLLSLFLCDCAWVSCTLIKRIYSSYHSCNFVLKSLISNSIVEEILPYLSNVSIFWVSFYIKVSLLSTKLFLSQPMPTLFVQSLSWWLINQVISSWKENNWCQRQVDSQNYFYSKRSKIVILWNTYLWHQVFSSRLEINHVIHQKFNKSTELKKLIYSLH